MRSQAIGTADARYNLVSVLYHALKGASNCEQYAADVEGEGNEELREFFQGATRIQRELADRAKKLLGISDIGEESQETAEGWEGRPNEARQ